MFSTRSFGRLVVDSQKIRQTNIHFLYLANFTHAESPLEVLRRKSGGMHKLCYWLPVYYILLRHQYNLYVHTCSLTLMLKNLCMIILMVY